MATKGRKPKAAAASAPNGKAAKSYSHPKAQALMRPDVGTQAQFKKKKEPKKYDYDSSISPHLDWDAKNPAREQGEALIREILDAPGVDLPDSLRKQVAEAKGDLFVSAVGDALNEAETSIRTMKAAADKLRRISKPFLNWAGKAERLSFDVPTLPLFVHERLSTKAILETLKGHKRDKQIDMFDLFGDPSHSITDQILKAYEYPEPWVNRMILGDSLVVMNSLLEYESMGGKVQMIYMDPPYGVKFGSNFQPFVRNRDVVHGDDEDMTREPEMVQAYRDTWELGLHSYLTYLRDRLLLCRELLAPMGSIFVQINDTNMHHVKELMDEVFDSRNFSAIITYAKTTSTTGDDLSVVNDYILWYFRDYESNPKARRLFKAKRPGEVGGTGYNKLRLPDGTISPLSDFDELPEGARICTTGDLTSSKPPGDFPVQFAGKTWRPQKGYWKTGEIGMQRLIAANRVGAGDKTLSYIRYLDDFPVFEINNLWTDTVGQNQFGPGGKIYAVQTANIAIQRCMLMTTDPGDLVLDPTCGSGTSAYVAEQWGRRWITSDVSRVPLALARQRVLTATFPWFELQEEGRGPSGGFRYVRKRNSKGQEVGGLVPHVKLEDVANNEPSTEEVIVDRPQVIEGVTRVSGSFCVESSIPMPSQVDSESPTDEGNGEHFVNRMLEVLRKSPVLRLPGNKTVTFKNIRPPAKSLTISAEGVIVNGEDKPVAFVFGPENGAITESLVFDAAREAYMKGFAHLFVIGFAVEAKARTFIDRCGEVVGVQATYVQATTDLTMSDLLKTMRSSQIFSVCGLPDVRIIQSKGEDGPVFKVEVLGLDVFDPITMETQHYKSVEATEQDKVPAWFLDTDYNNLVFHVSQAFFPRTAAWDSLKRALKGTYDDSVWDHLAGTISEPFEAGDHKQIAVKVIDDRGNELLVVKSLAEAQKSK